MYKSQLQELAQRSCFNLPSYACSREGPDHAPRFKASVNFNGDIFESPIYCTTLRQAEHAAAEVALNVLSTRCPSSSLTAKVLDETGVYKNLLQETAHRAGLKLPVYTTVRSGPGHVPVFTCTVELAGMNFTGDSAKTKKQAEKNAAIAAWSSLKTMPNLVSLSQTPSKKIDNGEEQNRVNVGTVISNFGLKQEEKPIGGRYQNRAGRRMVGGQSRRDNGSSNSLQRRLRDLLIDSSSETSTQNQNSFVSQLPPPPPRTTLKILPSTSSRERPSLYHLVPAQMQEVPPQLDGNERLDGKAEVIIKMPIEKQGPRPSKSTSSVVQVYTANTDIGTKLLGPPTPSQMEVSPVKAPRRTIYTGGYHHPHRIAPAVQIRSVIPVCAAPTSPPPPPMRRPPLPSMKEAASTSEQRCNQPARRSTDYSYTQPNSSLCSTSRSHEKRENQHK